MSTEATAFDRTERGFSCASFTDRYGASCSMQKSSLAEEDCIWLGVDDAEPKIMCSDARKHGLTPASPSGWMPYPIPADVLLTTRMHLTRDMAASLIPVLQHFVETGDLPNSSR